MSGCAYRRFRLFFRLLATVVVAGIAGWMFNLWQAGHLTPKGMTTAVALGWPLAALAIMLYTWWHIVTSKTTLTAKALHQSWVWDKKMEVGELAYGKLIRVRGLDWLIAPRLVRAGRCWANSRCSTPPMRRMIAEFERLIAELKAFRGFKKPSCRTDPACRDWIAASMQRPDSL